jgi:hypothetical protein
MTEQVKQMLDDLGDWRGTRALYIRELILKADSDLSEQIKWNSPVFIKKKNICSIGIFKEFAYCHGPCFGCAGKDARQ